MSTAIQQAVHYLRDALMGEGVVMDSDAPIIIVLTREDGYRLESHLIRSLHVEQMADPQSRGSARIADVPYRWVRLDGVTFRWPVYEIALPLGRVSDEAVLAPRFRVLDSYSDPYRK